MGFRKVVDPGIALVEGVKYFIGASDSPDQILVTKVFDDGRFWYRDYPYQGPDRQVGPASVLITRDLIASGLKAEVKHLKQFIERGVLGSGFVPAWVGPELAHLEALLRGETPQAPEGGAKAVILDYAPVRFELRVAEGVESSAFTNDRGNEDPWYAAEEYGGVAGSGGTTGPDGVGWVPAVYHVRGTYGEFLRAREDKRFVVTFVGGGDL